MRESLFPVGHSVHLKSLYGGLMLKTCFYKGAYFPFSIGYLSREIKEHHVK